MISKPHHRLLASCERFLDRVRAVEVERRTVLACAADGAAAHASRVRELFAKWLIGATLASLSVCAHATASNTDADFTGVTKFLQKFADFMTGPFGKGVVVISIIAAFCTWMFAPHDGIFGPMLRVVVAGIAIMNAGIWVYNLGQGGTLDLGK